MAWTLQKGRFSHFLGRKLGEGVSFNRRHDRRLPQPAIAGYVAVAE
jgi:hypothetical protein